MARIQSMRDILLSFESEQYGWDTWFYGSFAESDGIGTLVNELNTLWLLGRFLTQLVTQYLLYSFIETETELSVLDSLIWVFTGDSESDEEGFLFVLVNE